jgi:hypothetical protein
MYMILWWEIGQEVGVGACVPANKNVIRLICAKQRPVCTDLNMLGLAMASPVTLLDRFEIRRSQAVVGGGGERRRVDVVVLVRAVLE